MPLDAAAFTRIDRATATSPRSVGTHANVYIDRWWLTDDEGAIFLYRGTSAQCNANEAIARRFLTDRLVPQATRVEQIPAVFLPHRCEDYR